MREVAIVVTGEPIEPVRERRGGWGRVICERLGAPCPPVVELDARVELPSLLGYQAVIITGSAASVADRAPWTVSAEARVREAVTAGVPVLGICFGHQLLGQALGGLVGRNPRGREIGSVPIEIHASDPFLEELPTRFVAHTTHVDTLLRLPAGARVLASSELEAHAVVRFAERALGVQFHPEIDVGIMTAYVEARAPLMLEEGLDVPRIRAGICETPHAAGLIGRFLELCTRACAISAPSR